jgi:hypothetical protein
VNEMNVLGIPENRWPGTLENVFSRAVRVEACADGAYGLSDVPFSDWIEKDVFHRIAKLLSSSVEEKIYVMAPKEELKLAFADWLVSQAQNDPSILTPLRQLVLELYKLVGGSPNQEAS